MTRPAGGGGSTLVPKPAYQTAPGVPADGFRDQPDVSLLADPNGPGYVVVVAGAIEIIGGTSAAAPSWAGIVALLNDAQQADGLGPLNPTLYELATQQYAGNGAQVFHDVTQGDNTFNGVTGDAAGVGYDLVTGLGTPDVAVLAAALGTIDPTPTPPAAVCAGDCDGDGLVAVNEIIQLVTIALGTGTDCTTCALGIPAGVTCPSGITISVITQAVDSALNGCGN